MRVLMADTDETHLGVMQSYLWDHGHEAEIAADGLECIAIMREFVPDVLVLDGELLWGGCDGVLAQMRDDPSLCQTPVILIADEQQENDGSGQGQIAAQLRKPFRLSDLLGQLTSINRSARTANQRLNGANP